VLSSMFLPISNVRAECINQMETNQMIEGGRSQ
jgi:hypothetical protein